MIIYEYLFVGIIIIAMLVASSAMVSMFSQPARDASQKDELKVTAQKIMTQILLDPGFPFNWGGLENEPQMFGLAKYGETSREAYTLDPDKVQRLNPKIGGAYLQPSDALQLLNLEQNSHADYGFTLEISRNLNVTCERISGSNEAFMVNATSFFDNMPLANTDITAALYDTQSEKIVRRGLVANTTGDYGTCIIDFALPLGSQREVLIVLAEYSGTRSFNVFPLGSGVITGYLFSNKIVTDQSYHLYYPDQQLVAREVLAVRQSPSYNISEFDTGRSDNSRNLVLESDTEPSAVAILASVQDGADQEMMLAAYRDLSVDYRSIANVRSADFAYSLERTVLVAGTAYTATLYIWRMAN